MSVYEAKRSVDGHSSARGTSLYFRLSLVHKPLYISILVLILLSLFYSDDFLPRNKLRSFSFRQIRTRDESSEKLKGVGAAQNHFVTSSIPPHVPRFNLPWRKYKRPRLLSLKESNGRILYSPVRELSNDGLGHGMTTVNAEISTALRLGLTYTHRIASYKSLTEHNALCTGSEKADDPVEAASYSYPGAVEDFFGWGADEIPREVVQYRTCPSQKLNVDRYECPICDMKDLKRRDSELNAEPGARRMSKPELSVGAIVEIPMNLTYGYPYFGSKDQDEYRVRFLTENGEPNTVFSMPVGVCKQNPAYSGFRYDSRAFFFNKYWDAHGSEISRNEIVDNIRQINDEICEKKYSFHNYKQRIASFDRIPAGPRRPTLTRMNESELNVAIHARRGDFFFWKRKMVPTEAFVRVARQLIAMIASSGDPFAKMPVAISIYSEGQTAAEQQNDENDIGHDVTKMNRIFVDADGTPNSLELLTRSLRDSSKDNFNIFQHGLRVYLRISENTILCLHEMIASDIFIGSDSSMSSAIVGSLGRSAFFALPANDRYFNHTQVEFNATSGDISDSELEKAKIMWDAFVEHNKLSTKAAISKTNI